MNSNSFTLKASREVLLHQLGNRVLPFWLKNGIDLKHGGIYTALDRDGSLLDTDKSVWFQGRALWTFATAYIEYEQDPSYLSACESLVSFIENHCFDTDGRMFFRLTADGKPVIKRIRYIFSELFAVIGYASYSRASGKTEYAYKAYDFFKKALLIKDTPGLLVPKFNQDHAGSRGFGLPMILLNTAQELRKALPTYEQELNLFIDEIIKEIETFFVRDELSLVLEQCAIDGRFQKEHFEGRLLNPGHAIEGAWFILNEARYRKCDPHYHEQAKRLTDLGTKMLNWMWDIGWDSEYGGIIYFRDALGKSATEYWHDMKFWWPQNEAVIANLLAWTLTKEQKYLNRFTLALDYFHKHFSDESYGEFYGYLHRDGSLSTSLKGNMYKGPFHIPRMYLICAQLLKDL